MDVLGESMGNVFGKIPEPCRMYLGKTASGKYVLGKPPKKPDGILDFSLFLMRLWMTPEWVECISLGGRVYN